MNVLSVAQQSTISSTTRGSTVPTSTHPITTSSSNQNPVQTSTHTPSINTSPFFPEPSTFNPQPNPEPWSQDLVKTVLTFLIVILIVILVLSLAFKRYLHLKHTNRPFSQFFPWPRRRPPPNTFDPSLMQAQTQTSIQPPSNSRTRSRSRPAEYTAYALPFTPPLSSRHMTAFMDDDVRYPITAASLALPHHTFPAYTHPYPHSHSYPPHIATQMLQNRNNRTRTRAADTDAQGRRLDSGWDPDQFDFEVAGGGDHEDKETLPAYDCYGGPPKYIEVTMEVDEVEGDRGTTNTACDGSGDGRPTSSSAVVGHQDDVDRAQGNGG